MIKVLMVDDNTDHLALCREALPVEEFAMDGAESGCEAMRALETTKYDIVVLDYRLPDISGIDLLTKIRAKKYGMPIIFVTVLDDPDLSMRARKAGACDYILRRFQYYSTLRGRLLENLEACSGSPPCS
jgi:DNA-binding response OmpR family regulator